jgi:prenylcysteine oxidase/farnesylcysteine lyase
MIKQFLELYSLESPKWDNVSSLAESFGWTDMVSQSMSEYLEGHGVTGKFARELVEAATRVNYGQNVDDIHALEGACSMATADASGVQGGNFQIFEQFLYRSGAKIFLDTPVESITPKSASSSYWTVRSNKGAVDYKSIILAAPFRSTNITLPFLLSSQIPEQPYVHLHVTLLTTTSPTPNATYFATSSLPKIMLTTYDGVRNGGKEPEFNSLSYHGAVREGEWAVKIFSKEKISDEWLKSMFGQVGWVHRKEWDAYPKLPPTTSFPPVKLDQGFYYVNAFEPFISTMETETIASRNVVDLLLNEDFGSSICGPRISGPEDGQRTLNDNEGFVLGWDC